MLFRSILAVFLIGLGIGAGSGSRVVRRSRNVRASLGICLALLTASVAWTAYMIANSLPFWPVDPWLSSNPWFNFQIDLLRVAWTVLPPTVFWGAAFPLALAALSSSSGDPAKSAGKAYAANTLGAIGGALIFSMVAIPAIGTFRAEQCVIGLAVLAMIAALADPAPLRNLTLSRTAWIVIPLLAASALWTQLQDLP